VGFSIRTLDRSHDLKNFSWGTKKLDAWLKNTARQHNEKNISRTFVLMEDQSPTVVIGYYSLAIRGLTLKEALPQNMKKALPLNVPAMTLTHLAVSLEEQKKGHGERLLLDAMTRVKTVSNLVGGSFLFVDAKNIELSDFYIRYGFTALPSDPLILCLRIADIP
jgi:ribosomal protein S18 acetylase RimI-like enzyme